MTRIISMLAIALGIAFLSPADSAAQVSAADGAAFIGVWHLSMDAQGQAVDLQIDVQDSNGMLDVEIHRQGSDTEVEEIALRDGSLVLDYEVDLQGQMAPIELRLTPDGSDMRARLDVADGLMTLNGTAMKH